MSSWVYVTGQCPSTCPSMGPQQQTHCCRFDAVGLSHTHTRLTALCPGLPGWAGSRKVKPIWILLRQWVAVASAGPLCKSAPRSRQITTPTPHHSVFYGPDALAATQPTASLQEISIDCCTTAAACKCGQCHVVNVSTKLNRLVITTNMCLLQHSHCQTTTNAFSRKFLKEQSHAG